MHAIKIEQLNDRNYCLKCKGIVLSLTNPFNQFKKERIAKKPTKIISKQNNTPAPNIYERCTGQSLTPLLEGKIQYHKMKKTRIWKMRGELAACNLQASFTNETSWTSLLKVLEEDEKILSTLSRLPLTKISNGAAPISNQKRNSYSTFDLLLKMAAFHPRDGSQLH